MGNKVKKYIYTPMLFIILGACILSLPYYYQFKAYLSYDKPSIEFTYRNSAILVSLVPSTKAQMLRERATWFYLNDQKENCLSDLLKIEKMKQASEDDFSMLANCYRNKRDWTRALEYAQKSGKPNEIAKVYLDMNELDIALKFSNQAVYDTDNKQYSKYLTRAKIQMQMGRYYDALMDLNELVSHCPDQAWAYYERAKLKKALRDYNGAEADILKAQKIEGKKQPVQNNMLADK